MIERQVKMGGRGSSGKSGGRRISNTAKEDFYGTGNFYTLRGPNNNGDISKDMKTLENAPIGTTAKISNTITRSDEEYVRKTGENHWSSDSGGWFDNNGLASLTDFYTKVELNKLVKNKPKKK